MIKTIMAAQIHAGDRLVVKVGGIRMYFSINEVYKNSKVVKIMYMDKYNKIIREKHKPRHRLRIRTSRNDDR